MPKFHDVVAYSFGSHRPENSLDLVPGQPGLIISIDDFLTADECRKLIELADAQVQPPPKADLVPKKNEAFLDRDTAVIADELLAQEIWERLLPHLPEVDGRVPVGLHGDGGPAIRPDLSGHGLGTFTVHVDDSHPGPFFGKNPCTRSG